jgi:1-acyl-sn-glycerol-3-phosphate acyltransferase
MTTVETNAAAMPLAHPRQKLWRRFFRLLADVLFIRTTLKVTVLGAEHIPESGPTMVVFNHTGNLDPIVLLFSYRKRDMTGLAKAELYQNRWSRFAIDRWGIIPVRRAEFDRQALRRALHVLEGPDILVLAPEGTRHAQGMTAPREGVAFLAGKGGVVLVPTGIIGAREFNQHWKKWHRAPVTIHYGRPVRLKPGLRRDDYARAIDELMYQIAMLIPEALRGDFADLSKATMTYLEYVS